MKRWLNYLTIGVALIICCIVLGSAYRYKYKAQKTVTVTGIGEQEFTSDLIVWRGWLVVQNPSVEAGYRQLETNKGKVQRYITDKGIPASEVLFMFVNVNKTTEPVYSGGNYVGQRDTGYELRQEFSIESTNVEAVENISREISSLIAQGVQIESWAPSYYYTKLNDLKLSLIEQATADAKLRAEKIANQAGSKLGSLKSARMGVFQINGAYSNEEFSAMGNLNTSSKNKKAQITARLEYNIR